MKVGKHTLLIDGNYFIFSRLFVIPRAKGEVLLESDKSKSQFMRKLAIDLSSEIRKMKDYVDDIVVAVDDKSWRKDLYPEAKYKGNRKQSSDVNWDALYSIYEEFQQILSRKGVTVHKISGAEADDVLFAWSTLLNDRGKSCIVWTGDKDLIQLVNYSSPNDAHTIWFYNSKKTLYVYPGFIKDMESSVADQMSNDDILFNMGGSHMARDRYQSSIMRWIQDQKIEIIEVNCDRFIFNKVLMGDNSDNIPSVVTWGKENKNGQVRIYSITERIANKIFDQYMSEIDQEFKIDFLFSSKEKDRLADVIYRVMGKSDVRLIRQTLDLNISLMVLHTNVIPDPILGAIFKRIEMDWEGAIDDINEMLSLEKILNGTRWVKGGESVPDSVDPFFGVDFTQSAKKEKKSADRPKVQKLDNLF